MGATPVRVVCFVAALLCVAAEGPSPPVSSPSKLSNSKITKPTLGRAALAKPDEAQPPEREADSADEEESGAVGIVDEGIGAKLARLFNPKSLDQTAGEEGVEAAKPRQSMLMMFLMVAVRMVVTIALMYFRKKKRPSGVEEVRSNLESGVWRPAAHPPGATHLLCQISHRQPMCALDATSPAMLVGHQSSGRGRGCEWRCRDRHGSGCCDRSCRCCRGRCGGRGV